MLAATHGHHTQLKDGAAQPLDATLHLLNECCFADFKPLRSNVWRQTHALWASAVAFGITSVVETGYARALSKDSAVQNHGMMGKSCATHDCSAVLVGVEGCLSTELGGYGCGCSRSKFWGGLDVILHRKHAFQEYRIQREDLRI